MTRPIDYPQGSLWDKFYEISQIPRPSKKEDKFRNYLKIFARERSLKFKEDNAGNIVIYIPGTIGKETQPPVLIQNHMDMVTDALPDRKINFDKDPITLIVEDGWVKASGTTLGADNGIGCAAALALADLKNPIHPPLELLFTVDEETGLHGALNLDPTMIKSKRMLNLDTEEWGSFYVGCAGGITYELEGKYETHTPSTDGMFYEVKIAGLKGGHSGIDIHRGRGNAISLLVELLSDVTFPFELAELRGGRSHNIIPRDSYAMIRMNPKFQTDLLDLIDQKRQDLLSYLPVEDHDLIFEAKEVPHFHKNVLGQKDTWRILSYLTFFPHGAASFQWDASGPLPKISNNLAILLLVDGMIYIQTSFRFFNRSEVKKLEKQVSNIAGLMDLQLNKTGSYPSWDPVFKGNNLLEQVKELYQHEFHVIPEVKAIHAGLECGIIKEKLGDIDIISFGPTITGAHSPTEALEIASTQDFWIFLRKVLSSI